MLNVITLNKKKEWNDFVHSFKDYDTYYTVEYLEPFENFENASISLIAYSKNDFKLCYPVLIKDIADDTHFINKLPRGKYFDMETPYGYGGAIVENFTQESMRTFADDFASWAKQNGIVSHFFRFHPLTDNHKYYENIVELKTFKETVFIDLKDEETIYKNMNDKCRNMVKKALKNNIEIRIDNSKIAQEEFINLYNLTMKRNLADDWYFFNREFFTKLFAGLGKNCNIFSAVYEDKTISTAIIFEENKFLHYHLSAANREYMKFGGNNLLLYEVAKYGAEKGYEKFHLGGGVEPEDGLFIFKKSFNKNGLKDFYIGKTIFNQEDYDYLMNVRHEFDEKFDINNNRMIGYRA